MCIYNIYNLYIIIYFTTEGTLEIALESTSEWY